MLSIFTQMKYTLTFFLISLIEFSKYVQMCNFEVGSTNMLAAIWNKNVKERTKYGLLLVKSSLDTWLRSTMCLTMIYTIFLYF